MARELKDGKGALARAWDGSAFFRTAVGEQPVQRAGRLLYQPAQALTLQGFPTVSGSDSMTAEIDSHGRGTDGYGSNDYTDGAHGG